MVRITVVSMQMVKNVVLAFLLQQKEKPTLVIGTVESSMVLQSIICQTFQKDMNYGSQGKL